MKRVLLVLSFLFLMTTMISIAQAQEALTKTFTASDSSYSFQYPADWMLTPIAITDVSITATKNFGTLTGAIQKAANPNGETPAAWLAAIQVNSGFPVTTLQIGGYEAATVQNNFSQWFAFASPKGYISALFQGSRDTIQKFEPTILAVLATLQINGAPASNAAASAAATPVVSATEAATEQATVISPAQTRPVVNGVSKLVFPGVDGGYNDLFTSDPDGKNVAQLTQQQLHALLPAWSPDGTMIAYISDTSTTAVDAYDVFVLPSSGGQPHKVTSTSSLERGAVAWSPDSKQLLFIAHREEGSSSQIYKVNADGSNEQALTIDVQAINDFALDWSPDGKQIAFVAYPNGGPDYAILLANADGSNPTPIPNIKIVQAGEYFKWSPDGQHAVIDDTSSLTLTAADGSAPKVISDPSVSLNYGGVSWSPDGTQLAFTASGTDGTLYLYTINADGSNQQKIDLGSQQVVWGGLSWGILPANGANAAPAASPTTTASSSCMVTAAKGANLRSGPGTTFARAGALAAGASQSVIGQVKGSDGLVWWKLSDGSWVRSDLVQPGGDCSAVPTVNS